MSIGKKKRTCAIKKETLLGFGVYMSLFFIFMLAFRLFSEWRVVSSLFATALFALSGVLISPFLKHFGKMAIETANKISALNKAVGTTKTILVVVVIVGMLFAVFVAPRLIAQEDANYAADVCSESGINSPECSNMQQKRSVSCSQNGLYIECQKDYLVPFLFFYR